MSFVLEALKRQEAGTDPDAAVSLARQTSERRRHRLWAGLFAAAMVVNAGVLFWVFGLPLLRPAPPPIETAPVPQPRQAPVGPTTGAPAGPMPTADAGTSPAAAVTPDSRIEAPPRPRPARPPAPVRVALRDLPGDARSRFPGIAFSTHIYAEDPDLRAIVANGERLQEGDRIRGLEIVEITETGVTLAFERYLVDVPIVVDW